jgi:hypothetical protein
VLMIAWIINEMKKINISFLFLLFLFISGAAVASSAAKSFSGEWEWTNSPPDYTFSLSLKQRGYTLVGQYCAVAHAGKRIDCDEEKNQNVSGHIDLKSGIATVRFMSFFGASPGKATIKIVNRHLIWHITEKPNEGESYAPIDAIMNRE